MEVLLLQDMELGRIFCNEHLDCYWESLRTFLWSSEYCWWWHGVISITLFSVQVEISGITSVALCSIIQTSPHPQTWEDFLVWSFLTILDDSFSFRCCCFFLFNGLFPPPPILIIIFRTDKTIELILTPVNRVVLWMAGQWDWSFL